MNTKFTWYSTLGEYTLKDTEVVLLAEPNGYHLVRYDSERDIWRSLDGTQAFAGGLAIMPLPDVREAFLDAWEQIKDKPYANLGSLRSYIDHIQSYHAIDENKA